MTAPTSPARPDETPVEALASRELGKPDSGWRRRLYAIVFESDTRPGRMFDLLLVVFILASVVVVMLDSVRPLSTRFGLLFDALEWLFTALFTLEYAARLVCVKRPSRYALSFFGVIDLLAVLPSYLGLFFPGLPALIDIRILRLLRIFRILKMGAYVNEFQAMGLALVASRRKISVFLLFVLTVVFVMGTLMYVVEGPENGYTSIPVGVYWAIVTMTTVGYGDVTPKTDFGRLIAAFQMLLGWGVLAVPTGIVSAEFTAQRVRRSLFGRICPSCGSTGHDGDAAYCKDCGARLPSTPP